MHLYVVETEEREKLREHLSTYGISSATHYPVPIHIQPAYLGRIKGGDDLPVTESLYNRILTLPMYPELTDVEVNKICYAINNFGKGN